MVILKIRVKLQTVETQQRACLEKVQTRQSKKSFHFAVLDLVLACEANENNLVFSQANLVPKLSIAEG